MLLSAHGPDCADDGNSAKLDGTYFRTRAEEVASLIDRSASITPRNRAFDQAFLFSFLTVPAHALSSSRPCSLQSKGMALLDRNATKCFGGLLRDTGLIMMLMRARPSERGKAAKLRDARCTSRCGVLKAAVWSATLYASSG